MEYQYSTIVDPSAYEAEGLCDGIPLRIHQSQEPENLGAIRAQEDWRKHVAPVGLKKASLGPKYNFLSVAYPETKPERMEVLAYFNEFIFLHDDVVEEVDKAKGDEQNDEALEVCRESAAKGSARSIKRSTGRKFMMSKMSQEVLSIDREPAAEALALWAEWFDKGAGRQNHTQFDTLDEYLDYRILDVGKMYLTGVTIFAMGLRIPEEEHELRSQLCRPAWVALGLTNDLYSFDKELEAANQIGEAHVCNALWVMMREQSVGRHQAKQLCRQMIQDNVAQYVETVRVTKARTDVSRDLKIFAEAVQYILSGNAVWTLGAPRYNPGTTFNAKQLEWMTHGTPPRLRAEGKRPSATLRDSRSVFPALNAGLQALIRALRSGLRRMLHGWWF
ncbi:hypothetical protein FZEAL_5342 [Fusarium zealandicum]|uniref:Fusicoccadiene synthase n=1 Tax=Fusarium zealandicum TaxID=1053134 RepID=A0A8H4UJV7_9HYPO|nr:hypothetical protein FZEAL_5342 [Fusarium zealandicum]